eukprot:10560184-Alexandrium_andersonii.AAC.1
MVGRDRQHARTPPACSARRSARTASVWRAWTARSVPSGPRPPPGLDPGALVRLRLRVARALGAPDPGCEEGLSAV